MARSLFLSPILLLLAGCADTPENTDHAGLTDNIAQAPPASQVALDISVTCLLEADVITWAKLRLSPVQIKQIDAVRTGLRTADPGASQVTTDSSTTEGSAQNTMPPQQFQERLREVAQVLTAAQARKWEELCPSAARPDR